MSANQFYEFTLEWEIENLSQCFQTNGESLSSPIFYPDGFRGSIWGLVLYPKGSKNSEEYISLYLKRFDDSTNEEEIYLENKFELIGADDKILHSVIFRNTAYKKKSCLGSVQFLKLNTIYDKIKEWNEDKITLKCHIRRCKPRLCKAVTKFNVDHYFLKWTISKPNSTDWVESKEISLQDSLDFKIYITAPEDDVLIKLNKLDSNRLSSTFLRCKISLIYARGNKIKTETADHVFNSSDSNKIWHFPTFIKKSQLEAEKDNIFKDDTFTLEWKFSFSKDSYSYSDYIGTTLIKDLMNMVRNTKYCDVQLKTENSVIWAHKSILSARSPVFFAMFNHNTIENNSGIVDIVDCDSYTLKFFVVYLYIDFVKIRDSEVALKLLYVAEKYQVITLKRWCCSFLLSNLTLQNVCEILVVADMIGHKHLKSSALKYFKTNAKKILSSSEWHESILKHSKLAAEIISAFAEV